MAALSIVFGAAAVLILFIGQIFLLAPIFDKWDARAAAIEDANPGVASLKAELLAVGLGKLVLRCVQAVAWLSGLLVLPWLFLIVYHANYIMLPAVLAFTFIGAVVNHWSSKKVEALTGYSLTVLL
jgi:hypothetical protein